MAEGFDLGKQYEGMKELMTLLGQSAEDAARQFEEKYSDVMAEANRKLNEQSIKQKEELEKRLVEKVAQMGFASDIERANAVQKMEAERLKQELDSQISLYKEGLDATKEKAKIELDIAERNMESNKEIVRIEAEKAKTEAEIAQMQREVTQEKAKTEAEIAKKQVEAQKKMLEAQKKKESGDKREAKRDRKAAIKEAGEAYREEQKLKKKEARDAIKNDPTQVEKTKEKNLENLLKGIGKAITDGLNAINSSIKSYGDMQASINSRLQGAGSFSQSVSKLSGVAFSPLLNAQELYQNLSSLVKEGIVTNVEQRAFFQTVKEGIADTFDVNDTSLRRIIRIQQNDSTAARLGLESYLTKFLNVYVENTEYLTSTFDNVAASLMEASSLLGKASGVNASLEFEYIVQKWLGTLTGLGLSENTASQIATAIGQLGSGEVDNSMQNLMIMAANKANLQYGELLNEGLTASQTNKLFKGLVDYLQELAGYSTNVVKSQLSKVFGITVSDLVAITNLTETSIKEIEQDMLSYSDMYDQLRNQFKQLPERIGISKILSNAFDNFTYQTGMSIASNPLTYVTWAITDLIGNVTGGINIPYISAMGNGLGLETTVDNLIKLGLVGISTLGNIGNIISGISSVGNGAKLLDKMGINAESSGFKTFSKQGVFKRTSGKSESASEYVGNTEGDTYSNSALNKAKDDQQEEVSAANKKAHEEDPTIKALYQYYDEDNKKNNISHLQVISNNLTGLTTRVLAITTESDKLLTPLTLKQALGIDPQSTLIKKLETLAAGITSKIGEVNTSLTTSFSGIGSVFGIGKSNAGQTGQGGSLADIFNLLQTFKQQQLSIYQSEMTHTYYDIISESDQISQAYTSLITNSAIQPGTTGHYATLFEYLTQIDFDVKFASIADNVKAIADKLQAQNTKDTTSQPGYSTVVPQGFTAYRF